MTEPLPLLSTAVLAIYYLTLVVLALYGSHRLVLVALYGRYRARRPVPPPEPAQWPRVTVQLPLYNEMYVAQRLVEAVARLDYPRDRLEIQVLDDSTDETSSILAAEIERQRRLGVPITHLRRADRAGFKAGALEAGLERATGELIAIFDADFVPEPSFLRRAIPFLTHDPGLGMVQARWSHFNRHYSLLTRIQAIFLDGHFLVEHAARNWSGCFFNFNGTAGIWRRAAIEQAGGWQHDTVTEDLDLSYRAQLAGWRFLFVPDLAVPAELPVDVNAFKTQQRRWAKGSMQTGRKLLGRIWRARLPLAVKLEASFHLTNNLSYPLMLVLSALVLPAMILRRGSSAALLLAVDLPLFLAATVSVLVFYGLSQRLPGGGSLRELRALPALMGLGIGLALSNAPAVLAGLVRRGGTFERTPKYAVAKAGEAWWRKRYRSRAGLSTWLEGLLACYFLLAILYSLRVGMWLSVPFLYLFLQGFTYMFLLSVLPRLAATARLPGAGSRSTGQVVD
jgi:cellulose synthase/poly-beta-1,6-N-acetylglucosamine synthase-like glycosyltransferase